MYHFGPNINNANGVVVRHYNCVTVEIIPVFPPLWRYHNLRTRPIGRKSGYPEEKEIEGLIQNWKFHRIC